MTQLETSPYFFGPDVDAEERDFYINSYVETDTLCLANYFEAQVIIIQKKDLAKEDYDLNKIMSIFKWDQRDVIVEENLAENIDFCFEDMDVIFM